MWYAIGIIAFLIYLSLDDILKVLDNKNPEKQKQKEQERILEIEEKYELIQNLKVNIGNTCTINSNDLIYVNNSKGLTRNTALTGKILDVDDE